MMKLAKLKALGFTTSAFRIHVHDLPETLWNPGPARAEFPETSHSGEG